MSKGAETLIANSQQVLRLAKVAREEFFKKKKKKKKKKLTHRSICLPGFPAVSLERTIEREGLRERLTTEDLSQRLFPL